MKPRIKTRLGRKYKEALFAENVRHKALFGGRGGGKSWATATYLLLKAAESRKHIVCARQFQNSIRDSSKELIKRRIRDLELSDQFTVNDRIIVHNETGSDFIFLGLERNVDSIRSLESADICWIEEARTISARSMEILLPTIRAPGSEIIWLWNPEQPTDPVDAYFRGPNPPPDAIVTKIDYTDNPYFALTAMSGEMEKLRLGNPDRYRHVWLGEYDRRYESKVFTNVVIGCVEVPIDCAPLYGLDLGFSTDPSFIVKVYHLPHTRQIYIAAEACGRVPMDQLPELISSVVHDPGDLVRVDNSQPGTIEFLKARGYGAVPARKGKGSIREGITYMQGFQLVINPDCEHMRNESRLYSWPTDKLTGQVIPGVNPIDANNHGIDACRYAISDLITEAPLAEDDDGVLLLPMWKSTPSDGPWHRRRRYR